MAQQKPGEVWSVFHRKEDLLFEQEDLTVANGVRRFVPRNNVPGFATAPLSAYRAGGIAKHLLVGSGVLYTACFVAAVRRTEAEKLRYERPLHVGVLEQAEALGIHGRF